MSESVSINVKSKVFLGTKRMLENGIRARVSCRVFIGDGENPLFELNNFCIKTKKDGTLFVAPPQEKFTDKNGKDAWFSLVRIAPEEKFDDETGFRANFEKKIMKAYKKALESNGASAEEAPPSKPKNAGVRFSDDDDDTPAPKPEPSEKKPEFTTTRDDNEDTWL